MKTNCSICSIEFKMPDFPQLPCTLYVLNDNNEWQFDGQGTLLWIKDRIASNPNCCYAIIEPEKIKEVETAKKELFQDIYDMCEDAKLGNWPAEDAIRCIQCYAYKELK